MILSRFAAVRLANPKSITISDWIPADDKENVTLLSTGGEFSSDEWIWAHLAQEVDWLANVDPATGTFKDEL